MAARIKVLNFLRPKIKLGQTVQLNELMRLLSQRTGLHKSEVLAVLLELREAILFYGLEGRGVNLLWLGIFFPNLKPDGTLNIQHRQSWWFKQEMRLRDFTGKILNKENIGKSMDDLVAQWNAAHPEDPVET